MLILMMSLMTLTAEGDMQTQLLPVANDPVVSIRIWFKVGSMNDPAGKEGLANLTAALLSEGSTQKNGYAQILEKLYPLAAGYSCDASMEMTVFKGQAHVDAFEEYYPLFKEALLFPAFKQDDLDRLKSEALNYLENSLRYSSDEELGKAVLLQEMYKGTGYAHPIAGTIESLKSINLIDIKTFYQTWFTQENMVIGMAGGYKPEWVDVLKKDLKAMPSGKPAQAKAPVPAAYQGFPVTLIEKDTASTAISMGFPLDVLRGEKDWYALAIANSWLGEHRNSSSHLYNVIREKRGLNYGDYSYIEYYPNGGRRTKPPQNVGRHNQLFEIWIRPVPNEARHFALRAALREFDHLVDHGMTQEDFDLTRSFLKKYVLHYAPTSDERLAYQLDDRFYGLDHAHLETFRKMMDSLTLADVNAAIKKHWHKGNFRIAVITKDAASFKQALVENTPSPITYPTPKPQEILDEDKQIEVYPIPVKAEDVHIIPVNELFISTKR
ncbi:MAG: insulinase family protein [Acidobacteria bacterium]|nr:insulinase family protein [Acidobacteriota bacterium]MCB9397293.1 insulinase family protein [Acidobacteriota bacterium]